jgi:hypothetical protein
MVLYVHGGPWDRDRWGFNDVHQLFANRGYAVLSVNFRGSTGFGKAFTNAGDKPLAVAEAFLSVHIGGWYQPIDDVEIAASSMVIETGRQWLPGLTPCASEGRQMGKHFPICHKIQQRQRLAKSKPNLLPWKIASSDGGFETHISSAGIAACSMRSGGAAPSRTGAPSAVRGGGRRAASDESLAAAGLPGLVGRRRSCMHAMASASRH